MFCPQMTGWTSLTYGGIAGAMPRAARLLRAHPLQADPGHVSIVTSGLCGAELCTDGWVWARTKTSFYGIRLNGATLRASLCPPLLSGEARGQ